MPKKILFVCLGNICRSPLAHYIMLKKLKERNLSHLFEVDSCGTGSWHLGEASDSRMRKIALNRGVVIDHRAKSLEEFLNKKIDFIFAMDYQIYNELLLKFDASIHPKIKLFRFFEKETKPNLEVPDPYYGDLDMFEKVFEIVDNNCDIIINNLLEVDS